MKLLNTIKQIITEAATLEDIVRAIKNRQKVVIYYDGDEPGGKGLREIEPVCLGVSKANNRVLRAWDAEGSSYTAYKGEQPLPGWRLFRVDRIGSYNFDPRQNFTEPRPEYNPNDKGMTSIKLCAKFDLEEV